MAPKRRSLRERDQSAIAGPIQVLPGQTAIDLPDPPQGHPEVVQEPPQSAEAPRPTGASTSALAPQRAPRDAQQGARRLGIYFHPADFTNAKAAYLADWQAGGSADTFATWIAAVLTDHAQLSAAQRAGAVPPKREGGGGSTRSFTLPSDVHTTVRAAMIADRDSARWVSISTWAGTALHAAVIAAHCRDGEQLPAPPERLPNRLTR